MNKHEQNKNEQYEHEISSIQHNSKRVQQNCNQAINLIRQAAALLGEANAMSSARQHLWQAEADIQKTTAKRLNRNAASIQFAEAAKKKNETWWNMIKENSLKLVEQKVDESNQEHL